MIDRENRERLSGLIDQWLAEEIASHELDDAVQDIRAVSDDPTVQFVASALWCTYDDILDHTAVLSHDEWNYLYRLKLLLLADACIAFKRHWQWPLVHRIALSALVLGGVLCWDHPLRWAGLILMAAMASIALWNRRPESETATEHDRTLFPFDSVSDLLRARRTVDHFHKSQYPEHLLGKRIRSRFMDVLVSLQSLLILARFAPLVLLVQALPRREAEVRVHVA